METNTSNDYLNKLNVDSSSSKAAAAETTSHGSRQQDSIRNKNISSSSTATTSELNNDTIRGAARQSGSEGEEDLDTIQGQEQSAQNGPQPRLSNDQQRPQHIYPLLFRSVATSSGGNVTHGYNGNGNGQYIAPQESKKVVNDHDQNEIKPASSASYTTTEQTQCDSTAAPTRDFKRQRRLAMNRITARERRRKKLDNIQKLEMTVHLHRERSTALATENESLRDKITRLKALLASSCNSIPNHDVNTMLGQQAAWHPQHHNNNGLSSFQSQMTSNHQSLASQLLLQQMGTAVNSNQQGAQPEKEDMALILQQELVNMQNSLSLQTLLQHHQRNISPSQQNVLQTPYLNQTEQSPTHLSANETSIGSHPVSIQTNVDNNNSGAFRMANSLLRQNNQPLVPLVLNPPSSQNMTSLSFSSNNQPSGAILNPPPPSQNMTNLASMRGKNPKSPC